MRLVEKQTTSLCFSHSQGKENAGEWFPIVQSLLLLSHYTHQHARVCLSSSSASRFVVVEKLNADTLALRVAFQSLVRPELVASREYGTVGPLLGAASESDRRFSL